MLAMLAEVLARLAAAGSVMEAAEELAGGHSTWLLGCDRCAVVLADHEGAGWTVFPESVPVAFGDDTPVARALAVELPVRAVAPAGGWPRDLVALLAPGTQTVLAVPVYDGARAPGVLVLSTAQAEAFRDDALNVPALLALGASAVLRTLRALESERRARVLAEEAVRTRDALLGVVAHDLRNPLHVIHQTAELLAESLATLPDAERRVWVEDVQAIQAGARRMRVLIDDLVDGARAQARRGLDLQRARCDLRELARQAVVETRGAPAHVLELRDTAGGPLVGAWDAGRLARVLANLLSNAIKYSPAGGRVRVEVARRVVDGRAWATVAVRDEGLGVPADELPRLGERFHRARNVSGTIPGAGIGLATAREVLAAHGGRLEVDSVEGRGSTFTVVLPMGD